MIGSGFRKGVYGQNVFLSSSTGLAFSLDVVNNINLHSSSGSFELELTFGDHQNASGELELLVSSKVLPHFHQRGQSPLSFPKTCLHLKANL